jgi:hypothetical protein
MVPTVSLKPEDAVEVVGTNDQQLSISQQQHARLYVLVTTNICSHTCIRLPVIMQHFLTAIRGVPFTTFHLSSLHPYALQRRHMQSLHGSCMRYVDTTDEQ